MKIVVCVKHVPDTETKVAIGDDGKSLNPAGVKYILNPYDEFAVEEALKLNEADGDGEVIVVSVGPEAAQSSIRTALAMGADRAVLLTAEESALMDGVSIAQVLAEEVKTLEADVILTGKMAIDDYGYQVGSMLGELLNLPVLSTARELTISDGKATIVRDIEGGKETMEAPLPCVITAEKGLNEPRYPSLKGIMQAKKKPIEMKEAALTDGGFEILEMTYPPEKPAGRIVGEGPEAAAELVRLLRDEAKVI
ncbi:MAG: electron transfer flavoprotein subunit beta/FixA family protein [Lentisphaeria bacterium]|nr:electron transfer flavoprotein subunit beta/FixA family protein [Candidatus Neomarinimicrobiota bacterium]MCF7842772.1 electron transfer flavoprotein subunit beta/FixA family protein [Lentisphaeria bacterium]